MAITKQKTPAGKTQPVYPIARAAHIVAIRRNGVIEGHQLRIEGGGRGRSKFFSSNKYGGPDQALRAAKRLAREMGLPKTRPQGGSQVGRLLRTNTSGAAGIRFEWTQGRSEGKVLRVTASWVDRKGKGRHTSYSVARNGLEGALDLALAARTSAGAPMPDRAALLKVLRKTQRAGG